MNKRQFLSASGSFRVVNGISCSAVQYSMMGTRQELTFLKKGYLKSAQDQVIRSCCPGVSSPDDNDVFHTRLFESGRSLDSMYHTYYC